MRFTGWNLARQEGNAVEINLFLRVQLCQFLSQRRVVVVEIFLMLVQRYENEEWDAYWVHKDSKHCYHLHSTTSILTLCKLSHSLTACCVQSES